MEGYIDFSFDGTTSTTNGHLDDKLITNNEDSVVLLYRADDNDDWSIIEDIDIFNLGSTTDKKGSIRTSEILFGEFAIGIYDHDKQDSTINIPDNCYNQTSIRNNPLKNEKVVRVFPNPSKRNINISSETHHIKDITCVDSSGKTVSLMINKINEKHFKVNSSNLSEGIYVIEIKLGNGDILKEPVFISKN